MASIIGTVRDVPLLQRGGKNGGGGRRLLINGYDTSSWKGLANGLASGISYFWQPVYGTQALQAMSSSGLGAPTRLGRYGYGKAGVTPHTLYRNVSDLIKSGAARPGNGRVTIDADSLRRHPDTDGAATPVRTPAADTGPVVGEPTWRRSRIGPYSLPEKDDGTSLALANLRTWTPSRTPSFRITR